MEKKRDPKTEELSVSDLEEILSLSLEPVNAESRPDSLEESLVRTVIDGRYEVVRCLGTGAMGLVFLVRHLRLNKLFALKIINPGLAERSEFVARFEREADACSRLNHPNCISVTDFGQADDGRLFLVMEYADGPLLSDVTADNPLPVSEALDFARQILLGLRHAHKEGLIHRDIKLENVVKCVRDDGETVLKILDFGMAKQAARDRLSVNITQDGLIMGTPQYMSPEQIRDENVDARTDLYALGVTLFRMISGTPVFSGDNHLDVFAAKLTKKAPSLQEVTGRSCPEALEAFIAAALERNPEERFADADKMLCALERVIQSVHEENKAATPMPFKPKVSALAQKSRFLLMSAVALVLHLKQKFSLLTRKTKFSLLGAGALALGFATIALLTGESSNNDEASLKETASKKEAPSPSRNNPQKRAASSAAPERDVFSPDKVEPSAATADEAPPAAEENAAASIVFAEEDLAESPDPVLIEAALLIERRRCPRAVKLLKKSADTSSPGVQVLLGRGAVCRGRYAEALTYYKAAIALDERYREDSGILADTRKMLSSPKVRVAAVDFMADELGKTAWPTLIQTAGRHPVRETRHAASAAADRLGILDHVNLAASYELDLNQTGACGQKRKIISKLAALRTKAARQVLIRAQNAQVRVGLFRRKYVHECVRGDIQRALAKMRRGE